MAKKRMLGNDSRYEFTTQTNLEIEIRHSRSREGLLLLLVDGDIYPLTNVDAESIARKLMIVASEITDQ